MKASIDFNKILQTIITGLIVWVGYTVHKQEISIAELSAAIKNMSIEVKYLGQEQFTAKDFQVAITPFDKRITKNEEDLKSIGEAIVNMKNDLYIDYPNPMKVIKK